MGDEVCICVSLLGKRDVCARVCVSVPVCMDGCHFLEWASTARTHTLQSIDKDILTPVIPLRNRSLAEFIRGDDGTQVCEFTALFFRGMDTYIRTHTRTNAVCSYLLLFVWTYSTRTNSTQPAISPTPPLHPLCCSSHEHVHMHTRQHTPFTLYTTLHTHRACTVSSRAECTRTSGVAPPPLSTTTPSSVPPLAAAWGRING